jgi:hypothetical protein
MVFISIVSIGLFGLFILDFNNHSTANIKGNEEAVWYCGTMDLPENKVYVLNHPGLEIFNSNCKTCHALRKDEVVVGPSLYNATNRLNRDQIKRLLITDKWNQLRNDKFYMSLKDQFKIGFHEDSKFKLNEALLNKLYSFIDTITVIQKMNR